MKRYLLLFTLMFCVGIAKAQTKDTSKKAPEVFLPVEITADFPGGMDKLYDFIQKKKKQTGDNGVVQITFVVEKDGSLTDYKIAKSLSPEADAEAIRIMKLSPKWKPGMQNGNPVRVLFSLPIRFEN